MFVAKFFGRAGLMGFINAVPETQRRALFQSLLYEACGRTVNPVFGAVGLLWAGNWQVCQAAVETVLKGGSLKAPSPCSPSFSSLPQGPLHPSIAGKEISAAASRGRESLLPSITTVVKEDCTNYHSTAELCKPRVGADPFQRYESKEPAVVMVKSSWEQKWETMQQVQHQQQHHQHHHEWPVKQPQLQPPPLPLPQQVAKGNVVNSNVIAWPETLGHKVVHKVGEKRERECGMEPLQVVAPAPRRMKACGEYGMYGQAPNSKFLYDDQETVVGSTEHLDLGLTLLVKDGKGGQITGLKRVYSPSCDSVNSEGSVTSLDTTPRHGHGHHASFSSQMNFGADNMAGSHRKLLPLLM